MAALTRGEAAARSALVTEVSTEWSLDLTDPRRARTATRTTFGCARPGESTFIDAGFAVGAARLNGTPLTPDGERIPLVGLEERNVVEVEGVVEHRRDGQGLHRFVDPADGRAYLHTKFQPFDAHRVLACFDQPDVKGPVTLSVTAPPDWQVIGNTRVTRRSEAAAGAARRDFAPTAALPAYLVAVVAGPYTSVRRTVDGLDVGLHVRPALAGRLDVDELVELTAAGRRYYEGLFGIPYPFGDHYDVAFVPEYGFGAMEHPGCVTAHERFVFRGPPTTEQRRRRAEVLLHEMAHMWFGNLVTMRWWDDLWLNESFATLLAALSQSEATATGAATWAVVAADAKVRARDADRLPTTHPVQGEVPDTDRVRATFDAITYRKGAALLRQRLHETGRERFVAGLSSFLRDHAHGNASAAELHEALGAAGDRSPGAWARDWLGTTGAPQLHVGRREGAGGAGPAWWLAVTFPAERAGAALDVTVDRLVGREGRAVAGDRRVVRLEPGRPVELPAAPGDLALIPNADDGLYATVVPDGAMLAALAGAVGAVDDRVARAVVWAALWEAVVDARLPVGHFVNAVVGGLAGEDVGGVRQVVAERAVEAAWHHADVSAGPRARLAGFAAGAIEACEPGGDRHRLLTWVLATTAVAEAEVAAARAAGDAYRGPEHLELRWQVLAGRCRAGAAGAAEVDALAAEDASDVGRRGALRCRASWPSAEAKDEAWSRATTGERSLAERQALLEGWAAPGQDVLRAPFESRFPAVVAGVERVAGPETALALVRGAFPRRPADRATLRAAAAGLIARGEVGDAVARALVEQLALLDRWDRSRALDAGGC